MLQHLFTDDSREAAEIRDVLIDHQAHHHLQYLAVWGGSSAQLCSQIVDTITDSGAITPDADALAHALADYGLMIEE
ncbi:hypothetical protein A0H81_02081 [Grifola frondosa]|uniref:Uncharacterized protein n=1 Tax=Grifola frondosa TaxID=5627 RepID=A0A1C7MKG0_GRIFR|nr:hypothetical protein A0H81_02081 [Grifola frondosa]